jgi:hypothetical protein
MGAASGKPNKVELKKILKPSFPPLSIIFLFVPVYSGKKSCTILLEIKNNGFVKLNNS